MKLEEARRWKALERRARKRGWTIDLLDAGAGAGRRDGRAFALKELHGDERTLATGDLEAIEALL